MRIGDTQLGMLSVGTYRLSMCKALGSSPCSESGTPDKTKTQKPKRIESLKIVNRMEYHENHRGLSLLSNYTHPKLSVK